ncbi:MAG: MYG1 family protein [Candidatus Paceibacterota bacterium]|jgi:uncharacterized UPF0160 family protein
MKTLLTHNGTFHADDVFAVAAFLLAHEGEEWQVVRSRESEAIEKADAVLDTGDIYDPVKLRFDHHMQGGSGVRENGIPYAAFGLVWKEFGAVICGGDFFVMKQIDDGLVSSLDAHDNGIKLYTELYPVFPFELSHYVKVHNPTWKEESDWGDKGDAKRLEIFLKLVDWATELLLREIKRYKDKNAAFELVQAAYAKSEDKRIVILDQFYPWNDAIMEYPEPLYVVYPTDSGRYGKWAAKTVSKEKNSFESRKPFPESWAGKRDEELQKASGVSDATFCHNGRFLTIARSREGAIELAKQALQA